MKHMIFGCIFSVLLLWPIYTSAILTEANDRKRAHYKECFLAMLCGCVLTTVLSVSIYYVS